MGLIPEAKTHLVVCKMFCSRIGKYLWHLSLLTIRNSSSVYLQYCIGAILSGMAMKVVFCNSKEIHGIFYDVSSTKIQFQVETSSENLI